MTEKQQTEKQGDKAFELNASPVATLNLPLLDKSNATLTTELEAIFRLDQGDDNQVELHLLSLLDTFYPVHGKTDEAGERAIRLLADWLSHQDARGRISIENPDDAARIMVGMIFGGLAVERKMGQLVPSGAELIAYVKKCFSVFLRGATA